MNGTDGPASTRGDAAASTQARRSETRLNSFSTQELHLRGATIRSRCKHCAANA